MLFIGLVLLLVSACSTKVNKAPNRFYHQLTTDYNVLFHGEESFNEGVFKLKNAHIEDYNFVLPIFIYPTEENKSTAASDMDRTIEKCSKAIQRHSMLIKKKEYNKYIDDCYFLMGQAYLYKREFLRADENFNYVALKYKGTELSYRARIWLAKSLMMRENFEEAEKVMIKLKDETGFPQTLQKEYNLVMTDYYAKIDNKSLAITELKEALALMKKKKEKRRYVFILAQMYHQLENYAFASNHYEEVLTMNPPYEMAFYAKIFLAMSFDVNRGSSADIEKQLMKLLRDPKNKEYKDQIYFALAELELRKGNRDKAIDYLKQSIASSMGVGNQKGRSYLKLAELYFEDRIYVTSQNYYDSCISTLKNTYPNYENIVKKRNNLTRLVNNILIVEREDSLQHIASLSESERLKKINGWIENARIKEQQEKEKEREQKRQSQIAQNEVITGGLSNNSWYFSNSNTVALGRSQFQKIWSDREWGDNWRRKNKSSTNFVNPVEDLILVASEKEEADTLTNNKSKDYYLSKIPLTKEKLKTSHNKRLEALYDLGLLYHQEFNDKERAVESFEKLIQDYDTSYRVVASCYHLYKIYQEMGNSGKAEYYKNKIIHDFPESEYAKVLLDPAYFKEKEAIKNKVKFAYEKTYLHFQQAEYDRVISRCTKADSMYLGHDLIPKFRLLRAMAIGKTQGAQAFRVALTDVKTSFKGSEEAQQAELYLLALAGLNSEEIKPKTLNPKYGFNENEMHNVVWIVHENKTDINEMKNQISNFNTQYYKDINLEISSIILQDSIHMIIVKPFDNAQTSTDYFISVSNNASVMGEVNQLKLSKFPISVSNIALFYKEKDVSEYEKFLMGNYKLVQ